MRRSLAAVALLVLLAAGCESATKRCDRVNMESLMHELLASRKNRFPPGTDTSTVPPPPKPSDAKWYNEKCWEGKPR